MSLAQASAILKPLILSYSHKKQRSSVPNVLALYSEASMSKTRRREMAEVAAFAKHCPLLQHFDLPPPAASKHATPFFLNVIKTVTALNLSPD